MFGTLLGSTPTFSFQQRSHDRQAVLGFEKRLRQERREAYSALAGAALRYRLAELDLWHRLREAPAGDESQSAKALAYRRRTDTLDKMFRVQLITDDPPIRQLAAEVPVLTRLIHKAPDAEERERLGDHARAAIDRFVSAAATQMSTGPSGRPKSRESAHA